MNRKILRLKLGIKLNPNDPYHSPVNNDDLSSPKAVFNPINREMGKVSSDKIYQSTPTRAIADVSSNKTRHLSALTPFVDNRPEAIAQRKLQEIANNSPQVKQVAQLQAVANKKFARNTQRQSDLEEEELLQGKFEPVQEKFEIPTTSSGENQTGMPGNLKAGIENLLGYSMNEAKVHYNSDEPAKLQAHAYAQGSDMDVASRQEKHLPHQTGHVVQKKQGRVKPTMQMKGEMKIDNDVGMENEADALGSRAVHLYSTRAESNGENQAVVHSIKQFKRSASDVDMASFPYIDQKDTRLEKEASEAHYANSLRTGGKILDLLEDDSSGEGSESESLDDVKPLNDDLYQIGHYYHKVKVYGEGDEFDIGSTRNPEHSAITEMPYRNNYDDGVMLAQYNHRDDDLPTKSAVPNSKILWMQHRVIKKHCLLNDFEAPSAIENIQRTKVTNPQTRHTIWWCDNGEEAKIADQEVTYGDNPSDFTALLGTPNGRSAGYLLAQHKDILSGTSISEIAYASNELEIKYSST